MQHLGQRRPHARALSGGEDHGARGLNAELPKSAGAGPGGKPPRVALAADLTETAAQPTPERTACPSTFPGATVVFDLDGTLVDTAPDLIGALNVVLGERGLAPVPVEAARHLVGRGGRVLLRRGFADAGAQMPDGEADALFARFLDAYRARIAQESRPYPGVEAALDALAQAGARLAVCTNKPGDYARLLLDALDLSRRFAAVVGADDVLARKPDPRHLLDTLARAGGDPGRALMVGDSEADAAAARGAAVPVVLVSFGYTETPARELGADAVIDGFDALPAVAERLLAPACRSRQPPLYAPLPDGAGRVAQRESIRFTREGSQVQSLPRPPSAARAVSVRRRRPARLCAAPSRSAARGGRCRRPAPRSVPPSLRPAPRPAP